jgi:bisphosphoglycerate-dependent phosphoglycerate mutase
MDRINLVTPFIFFIRFLFLLFFGHSQQKDAPLASEGREEAKRAGQLLKLHGFEFDVVYTSWLSRAIETAWLVMDSMDCVWYVFPPKTRNHFYSRPSYGFFYK